LEQSSFRRELASLSVLEVVMSFRRSAALALAAAALVSGCAKQVDQQPSPNEIVVAAFNSPVCSDPNPLLCPTLVPTPNDLALQAAPTLQPPLVAQKALLQAFVAAGGFPNDQAVGITIPIRKLTFDAASSLYVLSAKAQAPVVDTTSLVTTGAARNVVVLKIDSGTAVEQAVEVDAANCTTGQIAFVKAASPSGSRVWAPGRYVFALRGGSVKTTTGLLVDADQAIALVWPNKDLSNPNNQPPGGLDPALVAKIEPVRKALWNPVDWGNVGGYWSCGPNPADPGNCPVVAGGIGAFPAVASYFPPDQVAVIGTFEVAGNPAAAFPAPFVPVDSASGVAPLPVDLLRTANSGTTIAFNPSFGPAAQGLTTLNGFSTTAMMLAQVTFPVDATTVNGSTVHVFKIQGGNITRLKELKQEIAIFQITSGTSGDPLGAAYVAEPDPITTTAGKLVAAGVPCMSTRCSGVIGLQPAAGAVVGAPFGTINMPPLEEETDYAVVITTFVKDMAGRPFQRSTVAKMLIDPGFDPVATSSVNGKSLLAGVSDETATALQKMRQQLVPVLGAFEAMPLLFGGGKTSADVAMAYTFRTQSVKKPAYASNYPSSVSLVGLPYAMTGAPLLAGIASEDPAVVTTYAPSQAGTLWGFDANALPTAAVPEVAEVKLRTVSLLLASQNQGAFDPAHLSSELVTAIVAIPDRASVTGACPDAFVGGAYSGAGITNCAPLVVFEHGITTSKSDVLLLAASLASRGFVVAAIDQAMRGDRSYCSGSGPTAQAQANQMCCPGALCGVASSCHFYANMSSSVDVDSLGNPIQIGLCETAPGVRGKMLSHRIDNDAVFSPKGTAVASANRLLTLNFFRLRDVFRQDVVDESALVMSLAPIGPGADAFAAYLRTKYGVAVDFTKVYLAAHSGGAISGTQTMAVNPRISRAVTYASGATFVDIASNPDSHFHDTLVALLPPGSGEGTPGYLKLLQVAKWVLDPAEPANYAPYIVNGGLPSPFSFAPFNTTPLNAFWPSQPNPRPVLTQLSLCDSTVPNPQNLYYAGMLGLTAPATPGTFTAGRVQWFSQTSNATCPADAVHHGNLIDFAVPTLTAQAQSYMGGFLASPGDVVTPVLP
jgi:hypothetical protein